MYVLVAEPGDVLCVPGLTRQTLHSRSETGPRHNDTDMSCVKQPMWRKKIKLKLGSRSVIKGKVSRF